MIYCENNQTEKEKLNEYKNSTIDAQCRFCQSGTGS